MIEQRIHYLLRRMYACRYGAGTEAQVNEFVLKWTPILLDRGFTMCYASPRKEGYGQNLPIRPDLRISQS